MKKMKILSLSMAAIMFLAMVLPQTLTTFAAEYDSSGETVFEFFDSEIIVTEGSFTSYEIDGTNLTIEGEGVYVASGSCSDGSITVKRGVTDVTLVLNGLSLASADTAPIACNKSSGVMIVVADGTTNTLTDTIYNNDDNYPENMNAENAVIKCKDGSQVTICGLGELNINANGKNGIKSGATTVDEGEAWMAIYDVTLNIISSVNDGINAEQYLTISSGAITVDAADDGIHCDYTMNIGAEGTAGPTINIINCYEGLEAATLNIYSGNISIHAEDDCLNAANSDLTDYEFALNIAGGTLTMDTASGDGIDSNGTLTISGGTTEVWSASVADNQPLDADGVISITGGTVLAAGGSAGMGLNLNAAQPYITFGSGAMGGGMNDQPNYPGGEMGMQPEDRPNQPSGEMGMQPEDRPNQSGGEMGMQPEDRPNQPDGEMGIQLGTDQSSLNITSGSAFAIKDTSDNMIYSATAVYNTNYIFFSSAELTDGNSYTLYSDIETIASATAQIGSNGNNNNPGGQPSNPNEQPSMPGEQPLPSEGQSASLGDINEDGKVDLTDANLLLKAALGIISLTDTQQILADVNKDRTIDLEDANFLLKAALGIAKLEN